MDWNVSPAPLTSSPVEQFLCRPEVQRAIWRDGRGTTMWRRNWHQGRRCSEIRSGTFEKVGSRLTEVSGWNRNSCCPSRFQDTKPSFVKSNDLKTKQIQLPRTPSFDWFVVLISSTITGEF